MKCFLLDDTASGGKLYLAFGTDCLEAAKSLAESVGGSWERFSVSGSWDATGGTHIVVSEWWPHFTSNPDNMTAIEQMRGWRSRAAAS